MSCYMMSPALLLRFLLRLQGKSIRMPSSLPPYENMTEESAFDNPVYESGVSTDVMSMQDVDSHNTSVLSWSLPIWLFSLSPSHGSPAEGTLHLIFPSLHQSSVRMVLSDDVALKNVREGHFSSPHCVVRGHLHTLPTWRSQSDVFDLLYIIHIVVRHRFTGVI